MTRRHRISASLLAATLLLAASGCDCEKVTTYYSGPDDPWGRPDASAADASHGGGVACQTIVAALSCSSGDLFRAAEAVCGPQLHASKLELRSRCGNEGAPAKAIVTCCPSPGSGGGGGGGGDGGDGGGGANGDGAPTSRGDGTSDFTPPPDAGHPCG